MDFIKTLSEWSLAQYDILVSWLHQLVIDFTGLLILLSVYITYKTTIAALEFSVEVAQSIIEQMDFNSVINGYYQQLPPDVYGLLNYIGFPAAANIILSALTLKFVMGKLGVLSS